MVLARDIFRKTESAYQPISYPPAQPFILRLLRQAKLLSQLITYIWLWEGKHTDSNLSPEEKKKVSYAQALHQYFLHPTTDGGKTGDYLRKLLAAIPKQDAPEYSPEALLYSVFGERTKNHELFPLFDGYELGEIDPNIKGYLFIVDYNAFSGAVADPSKNDPHLLRFTIPYPPSPKFSNITVNIEELKNWVEDKNYNKDFCSDNPYIPATCS
jgi:hypothetical protein